VRFEICQHYNNGAVHSKMLKESACALSWTRLGDTPALGGTTAVALTAQYGVVVMRDAVNGFRAKQWDGHAWQPANYAPHGGWVDFGGVMLDDIAIAAVPDDAGAASTPST
jgi:hypothetical protein